MDVPFAGHGDAGVDVVADALAQGDERRHLTRDGSPNVAVAFEGEAAGDAAADPHREDQPSAGGELVEDRRGNVAGADGELDAVERGVLRKAGRAVAKDAGDVRGAGIREVLLGAVHEVLVDVDSPYVALGGDSRERSAAL